MRSFDYIAPTGIFDALKALEQAGPASKLLAGGTDLLVQMKNREENPTHLIDLKKISELSAITDKGSEGLHLGPLATVSEIECSPIIKGAFTILSYSAATLGSEQVRNKATIGGNICHAAPSADLVPALLVLDAKLKLKSLKNARTVELKDFFTGPNQTILRNNEILSEIIVPKPNEPGAGIYLKHGRLKSVDLALVGVAVFLAINQKRRLCKEIRIALGSVAATPIRAVDAERILYGNEISESLINSCASRAMEMSRPITDVYGESWFKKELAGVLVRRAIKHAALSQGLEI